MSGHIDARLQELGITLPKVMAPAGNYAPWVRSGPFIFVSGQLPLNEAGTLEYVGALGKSLTAEDGRKAARLAAINILAVLHFALDGHLDQIKRVIKITGFVNADPSFGEHPEVINGASELFVQVFGDAGRHTRAAVGASSLPRNVAVEIEAIFET